MKYQLEYHPNQNCATIHLDKRVTGKRIEVFDAESMDDDPRQFVKDLLRIDGVEEVTLQHHKVMLEKGMTFNWEEIIPSALEILHATFEGEGQLEEKGKPIHYRINNEGFREDL